jgi:uncharacterized membrane protein YebE (DUF533 family)
MATNPLLGRDVYIALAAIAWADGRLSEDAADAILRTAAEEGLEVEDLERIRLAVEEPADVGIVDRMRMSKADRLYVYAVAAWIASLDGAVSAAERQVLARLAQQLGVPEPARQRTDEIVDELVARHERADRLDLRALRTTLAERQAAAHQARLARQARESKPD